MVALFYRAMRAIYSWSLYFFERGEQFAQSLSLLKSDKSESLCKKSDREQIALVVLYKKATGSDSLSTSFL